MRRPSNLASRHSQHPDGYTMNLWMRFPDMDLAGWVPEGLHKLVQADGHMIRAEFGQLAGFPCWMYVTTAPSGKTLGTFPSAKGAATWIARSKANA